MLLQLEGGAKPRVETAKAARGLGAGVFEFRLLLVRRFPAENRHRNIVRTAQITLHLLLEICKRVKAKIIVEAFLIISVASLNFSIMPRCSWTNKLMLDLVTVTEHIQRMNTLSIEEMSKLRTIIRLNDFRSISKEDNCTLYEIYG